MRLVADANVLFSSLIRDGTTRRIWFDPRVSLCAPALILVELIKYRPYIESKCEGGMESLDRLAEKALSRVSIVGEESLKPYMPAAASLIRDSKDWLYIACALKEDAAIWSNDKHFKGQKRVEVKTTVELLSELFK